MTLDSSPPSSKKEVGSNESGPELDDGENSESGEEDIESNGREEESTIREIRENTGPTSTILATALSLGLAACAEKKQVVQDTTGIEKKEIQVETPEDLDEYHKKWEESLRGEWLQDKPDAYGHRVYSGQEVTEIESQGEDGTSVEEVFQENGRINLEKINSALEDGRLFFRSKFGELDKSELDNTFLLDLDFWPESLGTDILEIRSSEVYVNEDDSGEALQDNAELVIESTQTATGRDRKKSEAILEAINGLVKKAGGMDNSDMIDNSIDLPDEESTHYLEYIRSEYNGILKGYKVDVEKDGVFYEATISPEGNN